MGRAKGSQNKEQQKAPHTVELTTEQKLEFLANLIVDRVEADQSSGQELLKSIEGSNVTGIPATA
jgi:hypothetical protein